MLVRRITNKLQQTNPFRCSQYHPNNPSNHKLKDQSPNFHTPFYTFSFHQYNSIKYQNYKNRYQRKRILYSKILVGFLFITCIIGNIYPLMMYIEYDINIYKPRVSEYILNRLNWSWLVDKPCILLIRVQCLIKHINKLLHM